MVGLVVSSACMVAMSYLLCLFTVLLFNCSPSNATGKSLTANNAPSCLVSLAGHWCNYIHTVTLTSSADMLCPGDTVVFTCVTDTGRLVWKVNKIKQTFHSPALQLNKPITVDIFTLTLLNVTNSNTYQSTAVAHNISVDYNWKFVNCIDGGQATSNDKQLNIIIGEKPCHPP